MAQKRTAPARAAMEEFHTAVDTLALQGVIADAKGDAKNLIARVINQPADNFGSTELEYACREYVMHTDMLKRLEAACAAIWRIDRVYRDKFVG